MGRIKTLRIQNYRSVKEPVLLNFPSKAPLVLVGENNVGKSNIVRALDLLLGEMYPGNYKLDDHEFHCRNNANVPVEIEVTLEDVFHKDTRMGAEEVTHLTWRHTIDGDRPFSMVLDGDRTSNFVSNEVREQCVCIIVGADRRLAYQLSYASKTTFLSKLMREFHQALTTDPSKVNALREKFEETRLLFQTVEPFAAFTEELKNQVNDLSNNLEYRLEVDFAAYDPSNFFHALRVYPHQGDEVRTFEEIGTGQEQILALCFAYAYAKAFHGESGGLVVVIEEPESHLHPLAQKWVSQKIHDLAEQGVQIVVTTHSPAFLRVLNIEGVSVLSKNGNATQAVQLTRAQLAKYCIDHGVPEQRVTPDSILPFYAVAATEEILAGLFARKVVLVEGPTEALALPIYLAKVGLEVIQEGIAVIPVHGVGNLAKWWRLFTAYGIPVYSIFDNDASDDRRGDKREDLLRTLDVAPERFDTVMTTDSWLVENSFTVFGQNFESTMRSYFREEYCKLEDEAAEQYGLSRQHKPLVARYVAERLPFDSSHVGWEQLKLMATNISGGAGADSSGGTET